MSVDDVVAWISDDAAEMVALLREAAPDQPVPACPGWTAADLAGHVTIGMAAWYCYNISTPAEQWTPEGLMARFAAISDDYSTNIDEFESGAADFLSLASAIDLDAPAWSFGGTEPAGWWLRRAATELTVHLTDAAGVHGRHSSTTPARHAEAIDELTTELFPRLQAVRSTMNALLSGDSPVPAPPDRPVSLVTDDTDRVWTLTRSDDGTACATRSAVDAPGAVGRGSSADVLAWLFGRPMTRPLAVEGDASLLDEWNLLQRQPF